MAKSLIIVESPAKARTITKIVGKEFAVTSSMGHIIDLPASKMGVDPAKGFEPEYVVIKAKRETVKALQREMEGKESVYLATDPDREGEAIGWHLAMLLSGKFRDGKAQKKTTKTPKATKTPKTTAAPPRIFRISFHEITTHAINEALKHPGELDMNKVNAQQARRVLDRLVGYSLSPLLWRKVGRGLSAGRVQSVATKLIVDREKEIEAFTPQEYWTIEAHLQKQGSSREQFLATLEKIGDKKVELATGAKTDEVVAALKLAAFSVASVETKEQKRYPKPPFTTSTLQQEAFYKLRFSASRTMRTAQQLYEGLEVGEAGATGLITYMRTDSVRIADEATSGVRQYIQKRFGKAYVPEAPNRYRSKKTAQEAHEAVRPTLVTRDPESLKEFLTEEQFALYRLIWSRFVASQMPPAVDEVTTASIKAGQCVLRAAGRRVVFPGFAAAYLESGEDESEQRLDLLPPLTAGEPLTLLDLIPEQHFTKPPRRYSDASLVKALEEDGIGRPSTYAPTIQTIVDRSYVNRQGGSLVPTPLGRIVTGLLEKHFPKILDVQFTALMEEELDEIEEGKMAWATVIREFYEPFSQTLSTAQEEMKSVKRVTMPTKEVCEKCGKPMVIRWGRYGQFMSCSGFPECKNAKPVPTGVKCPQDGGDIVERRGRGGRVFYGCGNYPNCKFTARTLPTEANAAAGSAAESGEDGEPVVE
ncbi:MAG: type I DNA topoisomerase [Candidatus Omnitrophica bacterium]|nr:type I DNA topoisomerase [Candidatus Omnitrophota bacterium]